MSANIVQFPGSDSARIDFDDALCDFEGKFTKLEFLQFKITLNDMDVPTWRRVIVPREYTLEGLHSVIMALFDWGGSHYHYFQKKKVFYDDPLLIEGNEVPYPEGETHLSAADVKAAKALSRKGSTLEYTYDLGDYWDLTVKLEDRLTGAQFPFDLVPVCTGGAGANPPEDVGGVGGYAMFVAAVNDPDNPEHDDMAAWAGLDPDERRDPEYFVVQTPNEMFAGAMMENMADAMVPEDPGELREAYIDLLAERIARQASDGLLMDYFMSTRKEGDF